MYGTVVYYCTILYCTDLYGGGGVQRPLYDVAGLAARARGDTGGQGARVVSPSGVKHYRTVLYCTVLYCITVQTSRESSSSQARYSRHTLLPC